MFAQTLRTIDDVLRRDAGCSTDRDHLDQTSWLLFLKYFDELEKDKMAEAEIDGRRYDCILDEPYRWHRWAAPRGKNGTIDHDRSLTGDALRDFVNKKLFPYLRTFSQRATGPDTIEYKIGEIFGALDNKVSSGYNLRKIIDLIDTLGFDSRAMPNKPPVTILSAAKSSR